MLPTPTRVQGEVLCRMGSMCKCKSKIAGCGLAPEEDDWCPQAKVGLVFCRAWLVPTDEGGTFKV